MMYPTELYGARYSEPYLALLHLNELRCTLLNFAAPFGLRCTLPEIPLFMHFFRMPDCPASGQFGIRMKRRSRAGTSPVSVPDRDNECRSADAQL
jgi:hypothetical protein